MCYFNPFKYLIRLIILDLIVFKNSICFFVSPYPNLSAKINWVSNSANDPSAIYKNWIYSLPPFLPAPFYPVK